MHVVRSHFPLIYRKDYDIILITNAHVPCRCGIIYLYMYNGLASILLIHVASSWN